MSYNQKYKYSGNLLEVINSIYNSFDKLDSDQLLLFTTFIIDSSLGNDLDKLGKLVGVMRAPQENDDNFRIRIQAYVEGYNLQPTRSGYEFLATELVGYQPTIYEYPDIDFTPIFGKTHPGLMISFTSSQINSESELIGNFRNFALAYKAAGIPMLIGNFSQFNENYQETILDILREKYGFQEKTNPALFSGVWDTTNWDESSWETDIDFWDGSTDSFYIRPESRYFDILLESNIIDLMLRNEKYFLSDSYLELLDDSKRSVKSGMFDSLNSLNESIGFTGNLYPVDSLAVLDPMMIYYIGNLFFVEQYLTVILDQITRKGKKLLNEAHGVWDYARWDDSLWDMNLLDFISILKNLKYTENPFTGSTSESVSSYLLSPLKIGSGTISATGGTIGTLSIHHVDVTESYS